MRISLKMNIKMNEMFWHKKAKTIWIHEGDGNTKFFHKMANGRKKEEFDF